MTLTNNINFVASAGTGKTYQITSLYNALIRQHPYPAQDGLLNDIGKGGLYDGKTKMTCDDIIMLTFTENAAGEMRGRITENLEEQLSQARPEEEGEMWRLLRQIPSATIGTIHSFARQLIKNSAFLLNISPSFSVVEQEDADLLLANALEEALQTIIASSDNPHGALLRQLYASNNAAILLKEIRGAIAKFQNYGIDLAKEKSIDDLICSPSSLSSPEELKNKSVTYNPEARSFLLAILETAAMACRSYNRVKSDKGALDFNDLINYGLFLTRNYPSVIKEMKYKVIIVDEAQDNSRAQNELIKRVQEAGGADLVLCGDRKQSIYFWRGADPEGMNQLAENSRNNVPIQTNHRSQNGILTFVNELFGDVVYGAGKYSSDEILKPFDDAKETIGPNVEILLSEPDASCPTSAPDGKTVERLNVAARVTREARAVAKRIQLLVADNANPDKLTPWRPIFSWNSEAEKWERNRPCRFRDIMILLRRTTHQELYEQSLRDHGIPYSTDGKGRGFFYRRETLDIANLLAWLAFPYDHAALAGLLRSPFCCLSDSAITLLVNSSSPDDIKKERFSFLEPGNTRFYENILHQSGLEEDSSAYSRTVVLLSSLRLLAGKVSAVELARRAIAMTGYDAVLAGTFHGAQKLANMKKLLSKLAVIEHVRNFMLHDTARFINKAINDENYEPDAAVLDPLDDAVKINTVHAAKGLSCPIVFVPDLGGSSNKDSAWIYLRPAHGINKSRLDHAFSVIERDKPCAGAEIPVFMDSDDKIKIMTEGYQTASETYEKGRALESKNLFYVACTRARDLLVLSGLTPSPEKKAKPSKKRGEKGGKEGEKEKKETWNQWINDYRASLHNSGAKDAVRINTYADIESAWQESTPPSKESFIPERINAAIFLKALDTIPSFHYEKSYRYPATLINQAAIIPDNFTLNTPEGFRAFCGQMSGQAQIERSGITTLQNDRDDFDNGEESLTMATDAVMTSKNPTPAEIGTLAHQLLSELDYTKTGNLSRQIKENPDYLRLPTEFQDILRRRISSAAEWFADKLKNVPNELVFRELPFTAKIIDDKTTVLIDGAIDLMFFKDNAWHIVDFKFSNECSFELSDKYALQLQIYRECISRPSDQSDQTRKINFPTTANEPSSIKMLILGINEAGEVCETEIEEQSSSVVRARIVKTAILLGAPDSP